MGAIKAFARGGAKDYDFGNRRSSQSHLATDGEPQLLHQIFAVPILRRWLRFCANLEWGVF